MERKVAEPFCYNAYTVVKEISERNNKIAPIGVSPWCDVICSQ